METWPALDYAQWKDTAAGLQLRLQIAGKVRLRKSPWLNHSWHATFYVSARGLTSSPIPDGERQFEIAFDLIDDNVIIQVCGGPSRTLALQPQSIAAFYADFMRALDELGIAVRIYPVPNEFPNPIRFPDDRAPRPYDADAAHRFWRALVEVDRVLKQFRAGFIGKASPVHLFWGSFDMAVTRFSGRPAPRHPGGIPGLPDAVTREAYSHEVSSAGFWPGDARYPNAAFYSYAYPTPAGFKDQKVAPAEASFADQLGEFLLPYDAVRRAPDPDAALLGFLQSTYEAAANLARWDRAALERPPFPPKE
jgi:hypothetical protein